MLFLPPPEARLRVPDAASPNQEMLHSSDLPCLLFLLGYKSHKLCGISRHNCVRRHVFRHNAPGANDRVLTNGYIAQNGRSGTNGSPFADFGSFDFPVGFRLQPASGNRCARVHVVDEGHAVANEDVVFNVHALTDERMARNLAAAADRGILLDFDERSDFRLIADFAAVQIDEFRKLHVLAQLHAGSDADIFVHRVIASPRLRMERSAASRIRTTRSPASPSLNGFVFSLIHFMKYAVSARKASICSTC